VEQGAVIVADPRQPNITLAMPARLGKNFIATVITSASTYVLRYWETEFDLLSRPGVERPLYQKKRDVRVVTRYQDIFNTEGFLKARARKIKNRKKKGTNSAAAG